MRLLHNAFLYDAWATDRLLSVIATLDETRLNQKVEGMFGSLLDTLRLALRYGGLSLEQGRVHLSVINSTVERVREVLSALAETVPPPQSLSAPPTPTTALRCDGSPRSTTLQCPPNRCCWPRSTTSCARPCRVTTAR